MNDNLNSVSQFVGNAAVPPVAGKQPAASSQTGTSAAYTAPQQQSAAVDANKENAVSQSDNKAAQQQQSDGKAYFAVDDNKNVVIKVTDASGKVVRQIPAEDYLQMVKVLDENDKSMLQSSTGKNMFHKEA
ncbi:MAG: flagellar protein FlaG [Nitrospirae bacterium]|nr:flagellar protein FlaG [Nitrospirota bacterium]